MIDKSRNRIESFETEHDKLNTWMQERIPHIEDLHAEIEPLEVILDVRDKEKQLQV